MIFLQISIFSNELNLQKVKEFEKIEICQKARKDSTNDLCNGLIMFLICLCLLFGVGYAAESPLDTLAIDYRSREDLDNYWLPMDHPLRGWVETFFYQPEMIESVETLKDAGFKILEAHSAHPVIAKHPLAKGYIFKIYPDSMKYTRDGISSAEWLLRRCQVADKIRTIIRSKKIEHFTVPDKWLYRLPFAKHHALILIATDMDIEDSVAIKNAWKTKITPRHLDELYAILSKGYGSIDVLSNIPYTKSGSFAFIDTENLKRDLSLRRIKKHLSKEMGRYWEKLIE